MDPTIGKDKNVCVCVCECVCVSVCECVCVSGGNSQVRQRGHVTEDALLEFGDVVAMERSRTQGSGTLRAGHILREKVIPCVCLRVCECVSECVCV